LDDVLELDIESILSRRLQTLAYLKGLANTPKQARQLICHGHIAIGGRKVNVPSYLVSKDEEEEIGYFVDSPLNEELHPARPSADFKSVSIKKEETKKPEETKKASVQEEPQPEKVEKTEKTERKTVSQPEEEETASGNESEEPSEEQKQSKGSPEKKEGENSEADEKGGEK
jgi:small subunit ribosomal protein S4